MNRYYFLHNFYWQGNKNYKIIAKGEMYYDQRKFMEKLQ